MRKITAIDDLAALYPDAVPLALSKVARHLGLFLLPRIDEFGHREDAHALAMRLDCPDAGGFDPIDGK